MDVLRTIIDALWQQDFSVLSNPEVVWMLYGVMFTILFLENGLLPVSFLPGDSLLLLAGAMIAKGAMEFVPVIVILTIASCLGCWLSYIQGRWLSNAQVVKSWLMHLPAQYHQRAWKLFDRHGLSALLIGRFLAFIRTLLPIMAGMSGLKNGRFQMFNWLSGLLWVSSMVTLGYAINMIPLIRRYENQVLTVLIALPFVLLCLGLIGTLLLFWQRKPASGDEKKK